MNLKRSLVVLGVTALAGCGRQVNLQPAPGHPMPVKPLMARTTPTVDDLLKPPSYTRPDRQDELLKKSEPRKVDPFDLPPPTGGNAPAMPAGSDSVTNTSSASTPGE